MTLNSHSLGIPATANAYRIRFNGNSYVDTNLNYYAIILVASNSIDCLNNLFRGMKNRAVDATAPSIYYAGNTNISVTGTSDLRGKVYHSLLSNGINVESIGTAAPVRGVWNLGDRCLNSAGVVGQAKAWQCTTAGGAYSTTRADATPVTVNTWAKWSTGLTVWECTTAGTTTTGAPSISGKVVGDTVTDGSVTWTCRSLASAAFTSEGNL